MRTFVKNIFLVVLTGCFNIVNGLAQEMKEQIVVPDFFIGGDVVQIKGNFDANSENTMVVFEKEEAFFEPEIIEENLKEISIRVPDIAGEYMLLIDDESLDAYFEFPVQVVNLALSIDKTSLHRREKTQLHITINGVENFQRPIRISIKNNSPRIIKLPKEIKEDFIISNPENLPSITKNIAVTGLRRGAFDIEVGLHPDDKLIDYDWEKLLKKYEDDLKKLFVNPSEETGDVEGVTDIKNFAKYIGEILKKLNRDEEQLPTHPITTFPGYRYPKETTKDPNDETTCNCGIESFQNHDKSNKTFTLTKDMKNKTVAKKMKAKGIKFPKKDKDGFKGENIPIVPGSAYATGFGDVVGGYANAMATYWGKKPSGIGSLPRHFVTEDISAEATALGEHKIVVVPAKNEWSMVIGVARVKTGVQASSVDPLIFERKLMKELERGKGIVKAAGDIYGILTTTKIYDLIEPALAALFDVTGGTKFLERSKSTKTKAYAKAEVDYFIQVNAKKRHIHKKSYSYKRAKIERPTFKDTKIVKTSSSEKAGGLKEKSITLSAQHPTQVKITIKADDMVRCYAQENGFSESGIASKTKTWIIGFCVDDNGGVKYESIHDMGVFLLDRNGKELAKKETEAFEKKIKSYLNELENRLNGKSSVEIKSIITDKVRTEMKKIMRE